MMIAKSAPWPASLRYRRFVPPLGWPLIIRITGISTAERHPHLIVLNRYPKQIIGFAIRLPDRPLFDGRIEHRAISVQWARPARWWTK